MNWAFGCLLVLLFTVPLLAQETEPDETLTLSSGLELYTPRKDVTPAQLEVYDAYQEAQELEAEIVQMYREIRAAELTLVQRQTLKRSLESVLMPLSDRAEVNSEILASKASNAEEVEQYQQELSIVMRETDAIVSNAQALLESLLGETEPKSSVRKEEQEEKEKTETAEQKQEPREEQEAQEQQSAEQAREQKAAREKQKQAERERKEKQAEEALEKTELHLEKALEEIQAARQEVAKEKKATKEKIEKESKEQKTNESSQQASEAKEPREKLQQLEALEEKVDEAEEAVESVIEKVKALKKVSEVEVEEAEAALEAMREAMAKVEQTDATAKEAAGEETQEKTTNAVRAMEAASSSMESAVNAIKSLKEESSNGDGNGGSNIAQIQAMAELAEAGAGKWLDLTKQMRGEDLEITPGEPPLEERPELWAGIEELEQSPTARKFSATTPKDVWIFIGDWYVLSRYDNEGRANIEKVYPPESIIDLNAQYLSEDGKTVNWEYESYLPPMVAPYSWESWKIYYFYTELVFAEETEAWLAIGSDDRSDLWINDLPVWYSANRHKGWYPAEGFRKVVFKKGRNKILLRLENGQASLGFSLYINLQSD